jgi:hypothetical protein
MTCGTISPAGRAAGAAAIPFSFFATVAPTVPGIL